MGQIDGGLMAMSPNPSRYPFVKEESRLQAKCSVWSTKARAGQCRERRSQRFSGDPLHHSVSQMDSLGRGGHSISVGIRTLKEVLIY